MFKYRLLACIEYNGYYYNGWQKQFLNDNSLQSIIENKLFILLGYYTKIFSASRTDKGVHSLGQIIHFDIKKYINVNSFINSINFMLPNTILFKWIKYISLNFHARYNVLYRRYIYLICTKRKRSVFLNNLVVFNNDNLNLNLMYKASRYLIGTHDFTSFRSSGCESLSVYKKILYIKIFKYKNIIYFDIKANSFLYHMVRNIVSSLLLIGSYKYSVLWIKDYLYYRDKSAFNINIVKPYGLYLVSIYYN